MEHIQDLGKFEDKVLAQMLLGTLITGDQKVYRKICQEIEVRRRTLAVPDVAIFCPNCNYMAKYPVCTKCGHSITATQVS